MNLSGFRTEVAAVLSLNVGDTDELALIDQWINDGVAYVVGETHAKVTVGTTTLTAGTGDYELDTDILRILWIETASSGSNYELEPVTPAEISRSRLNASSSSPSYRYALDGANLLMLDPVPAAADVLTIRYVPRPVQLVTAGATPTEIPAEFHYLVTLYAKVFGGDYDDDQTSAQGERYDQKLEKGIARMRRQLNRKRGRSLARAEFMPHRRRPSSRDRTTIY